jgi:hypothetical protein
MNAGPDFSGKMSSASERVRMEAQIRANMFRKLTGREAGLVGLWSFNDGTANDASTNGYHGKLSSGATVVKAPRPASRQISQPAILFGAVKDSLGNPVADASIRLWREDELMAMGTSQSDGSYSMVLRTGDETLDLQATAGDIGAWMMDVSCPRGQRKEVNLSLTNAVSIAGKVAAFDGSLLPEVIVQVVRADAPPREAGRPRRRDWRGRRSPRRPTRRRITVSSISGPVFTK